MRRSDYGPTLATGSDGAFLFDGLLAGVCTVSAYCPGYMEEGAAADSGDMDVVITLLRAASVSGIVTMPDGTPAAGAAVSVRSGYPRAKTGVDGRFELTSVDPRVREITASLDRTAGASAAVLLEEGSIVSDLRLRLAPRVRSFAKLRVLDGAGRRIPDACIRGASDEHIHTNIAGLAILVVPRPPRTDMELSVEAKGFRDTSVRVLTGASENGTPFLDVVLRDAVVVRLDVRGPDGRVLDAYASFSGGEASQLDGEPGWYLDPDATYSVRVVARGHLSFDLPEWTPPPDGGVLPVTLRRGAIVRGRVANAQGWAEVRSDSGANNQTACDPDGSFVFDDVAEGRGVLALYDESGILGAAIDITTASGEMTDLGTVTLAPPISITGRVVDAESRPLGGIRVHIATTGPHSGGYSYSHADGTFRLLAPGFVPVRVVASKRGFGTARGALGTGGARDVGTIVLPRPGTVEITVQDPDAAGSRSLSAELLWPDGAAVERSSDELPWRIADVAPGRYLARLRGGDAMLEREIDVAAGETTVVTFRPDR